LRCSFLPDYSFFRQIFTSGFRGDSLGVMKSRSAPAYPKIVFNLAAIVSARAVPVFDPAVTKLNAFENVLLLPLI